MRRVAFFVLVALSGITASGQALLDCVEPDVLRALLPQGQGQGVPTITGEMPQELSALKLPGTFTWIGSAERIAGRVNATTSLSQVSAAWRSNLGPEAARVAAAAALTTSGWEVRPPMGMRVFTSASVPVTQTACREGRPVSLNASAMDGVTYVLVTFQRGNSGTNSACNQPSAVFSTGTVLEPYLPQLELPVDPATGAAAILRSGSFGGGAGGAVHARAEFRASESASNVARHFARLMAEQGWTSDADWHGASTAGSSWSKRPEAGTLVQGTVMVTAVDERQFVAVLRVSRLP